MNEQPPAPPSGSKRPRKEKTYKDLPTAVEIPQLPTHEKPFEELTVEELGEIVREYDRVIADLLKKNTGVWNLDWAMAEATQKQAQYKMRWYDLQKGSEKP